VFRPAFALALLSLSASHPLPDDRDRAVSMPFQVERAGEIAVEVRINGLGPFLFLLDTGSSHSAVSDEVARSAGAPAVARTVVTSPIGEETRVVVRVDHLAVGPTVTRGVLASVVRQASLDPRGRIRGILGQDVLAAHRYTLDFVDRRVLWNGTVESRPDRAWTTRMEFEAGRFLVLFPQRSSVLRLVPDSGSQGLVLFERRGRPIHPAFPSLAPLDLATLGFRKPVRQVLLDEIRLGLGALRDVPAAIVPRPAATAAEGDGLLPLHVFERVTLDGPARLLTVSALRPGAFRP
jgi:Aspartyl protease